MTSTPKKWTREWVLRRLLHENRRLLDRNTKDGSKEFYVNEGRVRELMDMLEGR